MAEISSSKQYASGLILFDQLESYIGRITINNPSKRNAISSSMWLGISTLLDDCLQNHPSLRVLILTGAGQLAFCSGADLSEDETAYQTLVPNIRIKLARFPIPILASIRGYCLGGGLALAMSVDIRIASRTAMFSIPAVKLGLPCPIDIIDRLIELIGESQAKMILYTGDRIRADEAYHMGLIQRICDDDMLDQCVFDLARTMACNAPLSMRVVKMIIERKDDDDDRLAIDQAIDACRNSNDCNEGRQAFREKRQPSFQGS